MGHQPEGPLSLIPTGALQLFLHRPGRRCPPEDDDPARADLRVGSRRDLLPGRRAQDWSRPLANSRGRFLWTSGDLLWMTAGQAVDDAEETEVRRSPSPKPLVGRGSEHIELLPRTPSGESGIGRRRRSAPPPNGLPGGGGGGRVTRLPRSPDAGWIDRKRHRYRSQRWTAGPRPRAMVRRNTNPKGPCRSYRQGPFNCVRALRWYFVGMRSTRTAMLGVVPVTTA
jgi:hypothetical protein